MSRTLFCLIVTLLAGAGASQAAAPPVPERVRFLSLSEAAALALENKAGELGVRRVMAPEGSDFRKPPSRRIFLRSDRAEPTPEQQRKMNQLLLNVEIAYWNLYGSIWAWHTREQGLRLAWEALDQTEARQIVGGATAVEVGEAHNQIANFGAQRQEALATIRENESVLRDLLGMPRKGGPRLIPSDTPRITKASPDWQAALTDALNHRPELAIARQQVAFYQRILAGEECRVGPFVLLSTLQNRAPLRRAFGLALEALKDQESKAQDFLDLQYRRISTSHENIRGYQAQRERFGEAAVIRKQSVLAGQGTLEDMLETELYWAESFKCEFQQIVAYNNALAGFDFARGVSSARFGIVWQKDRSGNEKLIRAAEKERQRTQAAVRRLPSLPTKRTLPGTDWETGEDRKTAPSLAALWKGLTRAELASSFER